MSAQPTTTEELLTAIRSGLRPDYLFFWGHTPPKAGEVGKQCLSQWWPSSFTVDGVTYSSAEHFMMAEKAGIFGDEATRAEILQAPDPRAAKALGRKVQGYSDESWNAVRFDIVVRGNSAKFGQDAALRSFLLGTGDRVLVEASPSDKIWGIGLTEDDPRALDPEQWQGLNLLGFALMAARAALK